MVVDFGGGLGDEVGGGGVSLEVDVGAECLRVMVVVVVVEDVVVGEEVLFEEVEFGEGGGGWWWWWGFGGCFGFAFGFLGEEGLGAGGGVVGWG